MIEIYKLNEKSIAKLKAAIRSADFETEFKVKYLKGKDNGFSKFKIDI